MINAATQYSVIESSRTGAASTSARAKGEKGPVSRLQDEVEISPEMRGVLVRLHDEPQVDPELKALLQTPMTERRANDVLQKVKFGYYRQPLVVQHIANALAEALAEPI